MRLHLTSDEYQSKRLFRLTVITTGVYPQVSICPPSPVFTSPSRLSGHCTTIQIQNKVERQGLVNNDVKIGITVGLWHGGKLFYKLKPMHQGGKLCMQEVDALPSSFSSSISRIVSRVGYVLSFLFLGNWDREIHLMTPNELAAEKSGREINFCMAS